mmetsp:Transcript_2208/g.4529  ORF Transcript_2208/g.4529 Transcript_2208/m.4529 type:complete len:94 (+) Transcript_2208:43-324(+)
MKAGQPYHAPHHWPTLPRPQLHDRVCVFMTPVGRWRACVCPHAGGRSITRHQNLRVQPIAFSLLVKQVHKRRSGVTIWFHWKRMYLADGATCT